ncbi:hypothetical protein BHQ19_21495 [Mycolicibacterium porcinum]|nr:hypothetical protein BHQ19_21495 [Mycolicibacterium porcinum]
MGHITGVASATAPRSVQAVAKLSAGVLLYRLAAELTCELVEYHSARGTFSTDPAADPGLAEDWTGTATAVVPVEAELAPQLAVAAAAEPVGGDGALTRLGPLPPLRMDPVSGPIMSRYRELALQRYGQAVTAEGAEWTTWP